MDGRPSTFRSHRTSGNLQSACFLRSNNRKKDGKDHRYFSIVENHPWLPTKRCSERFSISARSTIKQLTGEKEDPRTVQEMMRHSNSNITLDLYTINNGAADYGSGIASESVRAQGVGELNGMENGTGSFSGPSLGIMESISRRVAQLVRALP